jgi:hypothetical protein
MMGVSGPNCDLVNFTEWVVHAAFCGMCWSAWSGTGEKLVPESSQIIRGSSVPRIIQFIYLCFCRQTYPLFCIFLYMYTYVAINESKTISHCASRTDILPKTLICTN